MKVEAKKRFEQPLVSVVIPTYNSERTLQLCLESIKNQTYPNVETILVDRYSQDRTVRIAERFNARVLSLMCERSSAKNLGGKEARGEFIFFVDSDMELTPKVIEECIVTCLQKDMHAIIIPEISVGEGVLAQCREIEKETREAQKLSGIPRFFRKEIFHSVGGFDEKLVYGEDLDLYTRIKSRGLKTGKIKVEIRHHLGDLSMPKIVLKAYYYGKHLPYFVRKNPLLAANEYFPAHLIHVTKSALLREQPSRLMQFTFMKLVEYVSYLTGIFIALLGVC